MAGTAVQAERRQKIGGFPPIVTPAVQKVAGNASFLREGFSVTQGPKPDPGS